MMQKRGFLPTFKECYYEPQILWRGQASHLPILEQCGFYLAKLVHAPRMLNRHFRTGHDRLLGPPHIGEVIICLFVTPEKQVDRLADFEELFALVWSPKFGARIARLIYIAHAIRSAGALVRIGLITAIAARLIRAFGS
jgi:hypothetical protein